MLAACGAAERGEAGLVLLGMSPDAPTPDYGWIVPGLGRGPMLPVASFVEKPTPVVAATLMAEGALWNTLLFAARARALRGLIDRAAPGTARQMEDALALGGDALSRLYDIATNVDLSRAVLQRHPHALGVLRVAACGWTDLGTPQRVRACLSQRPRHLEVGRSVPHRGVSKRLDQLVLGSASA
jgi:mannose-1-phosphate guanylyltransferase